MPAPPQERLALILKDSWVLPVVSFVEYVVTWRDVAVSATYTACAVFVALFPIREANLRRVI